MYERQPTIEVRVAAQEIFVIEAIAGLYRGGPDLEARAAGILDRAVERFPYDDPHFSGPEAEIHEAVVNCFNAFTKSAGPS